MAKSKKKPANPAKKASAKAKPVKPAKKSKPVASAKKVAPKKTVAKKAKAPKKVVAKKVVAKKEAPKAEPKKVAKKEVAKPVLKRADAPAPKKEMRPIAPPIRLSPSQLNIFPIINKRPIAHKPAKTAVVNEDKTRYSDVELKWFEDLIMGKLNKAKEEFTILKDTLNRNNDAGTDATSGGNTKVLEDGAETAEKENLSQLAARQQKFMTNLENALVRIKNGTYGICSVTGKLIPKERLIAVPHTTQSIEAKMMKQD
jgi:RNA polymerase-binding transcription factor DksA